MNTRSSDSVRDRWCSGLRVCRLDDFGQPPSPRYRSGRAPTEWHLVHTTGIRCSMDFHPAYPELRQRSRARSSALAGVDQPAAHCASFPIGPRAGAPRSAVLAGKFSNRRPVVQINPGGFEHIACRFRSARCHRQPLPQAPEQSHSPSPVKEASRLGEGELAVTTDNDAEHPPHHTSRSARWFPDDYRSRAGLPAIAG